MFFGTMKRLPLLMVALSGFLPFAAPAHGQTAEGASICGPTPPPVEPTPAIEPAEICATIAAIAADSMEGRGAGTPTEARAAAYIAARFTALGLEPPGAAYLQPFQFSARVLRDPHADPHADPIPGDSALTSANVVGILRGTDPELAEEAVVVGAHYDHLGWGGHGGSLEPGTHAIHNGADDNASGVAGILELAGHFAANPPRRTLVFVAFGAEELGTIGSQRYVREPAWPLDRTVTMVNLDMVGRLRERLTVQGTGSSPAWPALLDSLAALPDAPELARVPDGVGPSDHASFYVARVPVLFFFTGAHDDYHRPGDDVERIDGHGEARVLAIAAAAIRSVADRDERVAFSEAPVTQQRAAAFRVALGIVPDYGWGEPGVRIASVRPGGPAERAGMAADDVLTELAGQAVTDVYAYTNVLASLEADVPVEAVVSRAGETLRLEVIPESR
jgi:Zn-dependent M28 family amino/carboxypeptidase